MTRTFDLYRLADIGERQEALRKTFDRGGTPLAADEPIFDFGSTDASSYERGCDSLVGVVSLPVGLVGPLTVHCLDYDEYEHGAPRRER